MKEFLKSFSIINDLNLYIFKRKWRKRNKENFTVPKNKFPLNKVEVGKYTYGDLRVISFQNDDEFLKIGSYCSIGPDVKFLLSGEHYYKNIVTYPFKRKFFNEIETISKGKIIVEDDVWIGFGVTILSGVKIGKGAVIGAGSVVAKDVPPYAIFIGNQVVKYRFEDNIIKKLLELDLNNIECNKDNLKYFYLECNNENIDKIINGVIK